MAATSKRLDAAEPPAPEFRLQYERPQGAGAVVLKILDDSHPVLRQRAVDVPHGADIRQFIDDMLYTMTLAKGVGLAAPQVGVPIRVIMGRTEQGRFVLINPVRVACGTKRVGAWEGCLSQRGRRAFVKRYDRVTVRGYNASWQLVETKFNGLDARVVQHELDHLDGVLMTDARL